MIPARGSGGFAGAIAAIPGRFSILWGWTESRARARIMRMKGPQKSRNFDSAHAGPGEWSWPKCGGVILAPLPLWSRKAVGRGPCISAGGSALGLIGGGSLGRRGKIIVEVGMIQPGGGGGFAGAIAAIPGRSR